MHPFIFLLPHILVVLVIDAVVLLITDTVLVLRTATAVIAFLTTYYILIFLYLCQFWSEVKKKKKNRFLFVQIIVLLK